MPEYSRPIKPQLANSGSRHLGLWYDKFAVTWSKEKKSLKNDAKDIAKKLATDSKETPVGEEAALKAYTQRIGNLAFSVAGCKGKQGLFTAGLPRGTRFLTGSGLPHAGDTGFAWHASLGVPYLPGSGVKGLARTWARDWCSQSDSNERDVLRIFGPESGNSFDQPDEDSVGSVIFFDAVPISPVTLSQEIITPHGPPAGHPVDAGYDSMPKPIFFLAVAEAQMQFLVLPQQLDKDGYEDVVLATTWLKAGLETLGAGARTRSGYGRMK